MRVQETQMHQIRVREEEATREAESRAREAAKEQEREAAEQLRNRRERELQEMERRVTAAEARIRTGSSPGAFGRLDGPSNTCVSLATSALDAEARLRSSVPLATRASESSPARRMEVNVREPFAVYHGGYRGTSLEPIAAVGSAVDQSIKSIAEYGPSSRSSLAVEGAAVPSQPSPRPLGQPPSDTDGFLRYLEDFQAYTGKLCAQEAPAVSPGLVVSRF